MSSVPSGKLRLHLLAEKAFGLTSVTVRPGRTKRSEPRAESRPAAAAKPPAVAPVRSSAVPAAPRTVKPQAPEPVLPGLSPLAVVPSPLAGGPFTAPLLDTSAKRIALSQLDETSVRPCQKCRLCETRTQTVFGEGDVDARLMFIGEGPGENEDLEGRPFVGRSGELLGRQILAMGLSREQVFIANVVKCRPPGNRTPAPDETLACTPYLVRQIEIVRPQVIVTLGLPASQFLLSTKSPMRDLRGRWHDWRGIAIMPTYHPSYLLRNYTDEARRMVWSDLQMVMQRLGLANTTKPK